MSNIQALLSRLDRVRDTGEGNYRAACPAHEGRSQSLSIRDKGDGRILLYCFGGCPVEAVCDAVGLTLADLMPERPVGHRIKGEHWAPRDVLEGVVHEIYVSALITEAVALSGQASEADAGRLRQCSGRLSRALGLIRQSRPKELRQIRSGRSAA